jgi:DeoR family fructose operon transcriptional repressor
MDMYAEERQQAILEQARKEGRVDVAELADTLDVTAETVRRDLTALERHGLVRRVHGGAIPVERLGFEPDVTTRSERLVAEKDRIAKAALDQVPAEGAIILDAGTTTARLAELLPTDRELTVVTNSLQIGVTISSRRNITAYIVGGRVRGRTGANTGEWALQALAGLFVDVAFLGTNGLSVERGLTTPDQAEAAVKRAFVLSARRCVVLADHSKVGQAHFAQFADLTDVDQLITDTGLDEETAADIEATGPTVVRA